MYYKITNTASDIFHTLYEMRKQERAWEVENRKAIEEKAGSPWERYQGRQGQQTFSRVTSYSAFEFAEPDKICMKTWRKMNDIDGMYELNRRTKLGREMSQFVSNGLKGHWFGIVYDNLGLERPMGRAAFPFVEICGDVIILFLDQRVELKHDHIIEITKTEFEELFKKA